jgi:hypothetical protein
MPERNPTYRVDTGKIAENEVRLAPSPLHIAAPWLARKNASIRHSRLTPGNCAPDNSLKVFPKRGLRISIFSA